MSEIKPERELDPKRKWILLGIPLCIVMGFLELDRAIGGNNRSWLYVFEWPFFGLFIYYMYWKLSQPQEEFDDVDDPRRQLEE
ncbi:unannotated protein [freshwater metagenome]|uniref:Unannotated protein n=1 Tax=freshwater metagenome TaxID=449393 RepID=A0A6J7KXK3_9ZZZZ|nr:hypothetical protein [Actinomycetota bacterium]MSW15152.1 hypothetical protein [Actinomycetota bacterium]MSW99294.1 hypothetical protein [Actinomycetota bacterium]MSZ45774.1 hypothetical protein [Actinomycetota bacterium]MTA04831.1 hypothetical protein [Actinomycetota bacterium]